MDTTTAKRGPKQASGRLHGFSLFAALAAFWLLMSGHHTPLILSCGLLSCLLVTWIAQRMNVIDHEGQPIHLSLRIPLFWLWLGKEILVSSWHVCRVILRPRLEVTPRVERIASRQTSDLARATLANAITLTPGTLSMRVSADVIEVHALVPASLDGLRDGSFPARIAALDA